MASYPHVISKLMYAFLLFHMHATCTMKDEMIHISMVQYVRVKEKVESKPRIQVTNACLRGKLVQPCLPLLQRTKLSNCRTVELCDRNKLR